MIDGTALNVFRLIKSLSADSTAAKSTSLRRKDSKTRKKSGFAATNVTDG